MKPLLVISGVNLVDYGPLAIYREALASLVENYRSQWRVVALVHDKNMFTTEGALYLEFPEVKSSWIRRIYFEYFQCYRISAKLRPNLWIAMHDMTPRVTCRRQYVYCHNPSPFHKFSIRETIQDPKFGAFTLLYRFLYSFFLHNNEGVIVQQDWIRREFKRRYGVGNVIVAHPNFSKESLCTRDAANRPQAAYRFFYPAFPRTFKNHDMLFQAVQLLEARCPGQFELTVTMNGTENKYSHQIFRRYSHLLSVNWLGTISSEQVTQIYSDTDCLVFPSKLETWGLPLTEFKNNGRPILAADLPYAHETIGSYHSVAFFDVGKPEILADLMQQAVSGKLNWSSVNAKDPANPFAKDWQGLWSLLLSE